jgi:hypothetical protein
LLFGTQRWESTVLGCVDGVEGFAAAALGNEFEAIVRDGERYVGKAMASCVGSSGS